MPDMTFDEAIKIIECNISPHGWFKNELDVIKSMRGRVAELEAELRDINIINANNKYLKARLDELEQPGGLMWTLIAESTQANSENDILKNRVAELERMVPKSIEAIKRGEMVSVVSTAHYRQLVDDNAAMRALMKKHEWGADVIYVGYCPKCKRHQSQGHAPGCEWGKFAGGENNG
jgi:hypothetical protein